VFVLLRLVKLTVAYCRLKSIVVIRFTLRAYKPKVIRTLSIGYTKLCLRPYGLPHSISYWSHFLDLLLSFCDGLVLLCRILIRLVDTYSKLLTDGVPLLENRVFLVAGC
jgi:hypothetical protein